MRWCSSFCFWIPINWCFLHARNELESSFFYWYFFSILIHYHLEWEILSKSRPHVFIRCNRTGQSIPFYYLWCKNQLRLWKLNSCLLGDLPLHSLPFSFLSWLLWDIKCHCICMLHWTVIRLVISFSCGSSALLGNTGLWTLCCIWSSCRQGIFFYCLQDFSVIIFLYKIVSVLYYIHQ
jgi:hypothetical protein